ncbi:MAG: hypothetical protein KDA67_15380 [Rhodobacteraceae bacterium]|nr:hypothetical protein [Paracoccaceae bacterium]
MRPVRSLDVNHAAEVLLAVPAEQRAGLAELLLIAAEKADLARCGHLTPSVCFGDGSLGAAAALYRRAARRQVDDGEYSDCQLLVFEALLRWRSVRIACN